jgi:hypothetical protein
MHTNNILSYRPITIADNGIEVGESSYYKTYMTSASITIYNHHNKPLKIYGIK